MSEEEEIIQKLPPDPPPPPPPPRKLLGRELTPDAGRWASKWSTQLAVLALGLDAVVAAFIAGPPEWRAGFPVAAGVGLLILSMVAKGLIPLATSLQQRKP